jgi:Protein of unknown function (DUF1517)
MDVSRQKIRSTTLASKQSLHSHFAILVDVRLRRLADTSRHNSIYTLYHPSLCHQQHYKMIKANSLCGLTLLGLCLACLTDAFVPAKPWGNRQRNDATFHRMFNKMFEAEGPLGKGITVGKVQVALMSPDRSPTSIFGLLERSSRSDDDSPYGLARLTYDVCMACMRKSSDWVSAASESQWYREDDAGKAESRFNDWANREAAKFEKVRMRYS